MIAPENAPGYMGFSPPPNPKLIATYPTEGPAVAVSRGLDRDRVVDESGDQTVVFGRRGSRPFHVNEMEAFYRHFAPDQPEGSTNRTGALYEVDDVVIKNRQLTTRNGQALGEPLAFKSDEPQTNLVSISRDRLE